MCRSRICTWLFGLVVVGTLFAPGGQAAEQGERHLLYVTVPDFAGGTRHKPGIYVYDIDDGHKLVKRIDIPGMGPTRGSCVSAQAGCMYISHSNTSILCFDVVREKVVWSNVYKPEEGGCDRPCVTPDGKKLYVPEGWWTSATKSMKVLDGATGKLLKNIPVGVGTGHNTIMSPTGKRMYMGPVANGTLFVVDTQSDEVIQRIGPFGGTPGPNPVGMGGRCSPFTINSAETLCFVNSHHVGFYVGDLKEQKILHWVQVDGAKGYSHGVGLTPDEKEVWLANAENKRLHVYDATKMPPRWKQAIDVSAVTHGWITFSLDGRFAWPDSGDVIDPKTKKIVATWKDDNGSPVRSSKFIEIHFRDGKPVRVGDQFGIGRAETR